MRRILVLNSKGGCGKSTLAVNLAAYYAQQYQTFLLDYDPQATSMCWLDSRPSTHPRIEGVRAFGSQQGAVTRAWLTHNPRAERTIIDAPAGVADHQLAKLMGDVDAVVIPVLPSPIDIRAAADFIRVLLLQGRARQQNVRIGIVANRVRSNVRIYDALERFISTLQIPLLTTLRDTQNYVRSFEQGIGIHEQHRREYQRDKEQWAPLLQWLGVTPSTAVGPIRELSSQVRQKHPV